MTWYAVQHKPSQGDRALANLEVQGVTAFYPKIDIERLRGQTRKKVSEALFPGYLFINLDHDNPLWSKIKYTRGVVRVVGFGSKPVPVADSVIEFIADNLERISQEGGLKPGQKVEISGGPFAGCEAIFQAHDGNERAILLIEILNRSHSLSIPASDIKV